MADPPAPATLWGIRGIEPSGFWSSRTETQTLWRGRRLPGRDRASVAHGGDGPRRASLTSRCQKASSSVRTAGTKDASAFGSRNDKALATASPANSSFAVYIFLIKVVIAQPFIQAVRWQEGKERRGRRDASGRETLRRPALGTMRVVRWESSQRT